MKLMNIDMNELHANTLFMVRKYSMLKMYCCYYCVIKHKAVSTILVLEWLLHCFINVIIHNIIQCIVVVMDFLDFICVIADIVKFSLKKFVTYDLWKQSREAELFQIEI